MWFKNLKIYRFTQPFTIDEEQLQQQLDGFSFRPCGSQEIATQGWTSPLPQGEELFLASSGYYCLSLKKQERVLPAAVVNAQVAEKVAAIEAETGASVGKKAQQDIKQEITHQLLPRAFTKDSFTQGFIAPKDGLLIVNASSDGKAEVFLAHLRKAIESLPVVPLAKRSISADLTTWLTEQAPASIQLLEEAELRLPEEDGGIIRCKNQELGCDEILAHLHSGKFVSKVAIEWDETLSAIIQEDLAIKRVKFSDVVLEQNQDIPKDQLAAKIDADFSLMAAELVRFAKSLDELLALNQDTI
ncbi:recombination-associated protein RdgC [Alteromonadaceae bacterium BrNp21-10]|nr:recombination-associated protein RdgC [Alteromonadaceae bacterium BrNp21-10]